MRRNLVRKHPQAIRDLSDIAVYLAKESGSEDLGYRFIDAAESAFERLAAMPDMGAVREYRDPALAGVRVWRIAGFDH